MDRFLIGATTRPLRLFVLFVCFQLLACGFAQETLGQRQNRTRVRATSTASRVGTESYEQMITNADKLVRQGQYVRALAIANKAMKAKPEDYKGYYYAAFALLKSDLLAEAKPLAAKSKELAPPDASSDVERLVDAITSAEEGREHVGTGERASNDGDFASAAEAYAKAYSLMPSREDLGFKAVDLYLQLKQPEKSIELAKQILLKTSKPESSRRANDVITKAEATRNQIAEDNRQRDEREQQATRDREARNERARREQEAREERDQRRQEETAQQARREEIKGKIEGLRQEMDSEQSLVESREEAASRMENDYQNCLSRGEVTCGFLKIGVDKFRRDVSEHKRKVAQFEREISRLESQLRNP